METGPRFIVPSNGLEKPVIEPALHEGLSTSKFQIVKPPANFYGKEQPPLIRDVLVAGLNNTVTDDAVSCPSASHIMKL